MTNSKRKNASFLLKAFLGLFLMAFGLDAFAEPPDFTDLTDAVDFSTVITALMTIMGALAGVYIVNRGGNMILGKIGGRR
ncbi:hypothetical protein [Methylomonas koyamae]|uniref:hypothetical protein n=1 Tax=Methylomonas koyamae TaxID=702114 RepID=UPI0006D1ECAC|nr:hypothetical protein [Methylomonas koyamae]BBL58142.1 hypothetical protein MKFW12EY_17550 [Methylomonas koyamae]